MNNKLTIILVLVSINTVASLFLVRSSLQAPTSLQPTESNVANQADGDSSFVAEDNSGDLGDVNVEEEEGDREEVVVTESGLAPEDRADAISGEDVDDAYDDVFKAVDEGEDG